MFRTLFASFVVSLISSAHATELNTSVLMFRMPEFPECAGRVEKAHALGNSRVSVLPTMQYYRQTDAELPARYCFQDAGAGCDEVTPESIARFQSLMTDCFKRATELGMEVTVLPHLDSHDHPIWRNYVTFDPMARYGTHSYYEAFIRPLAQALLDATPPGAISHLNVEGEMGASVFTHADAYRRLIGDLRRLRGARPLALGLSFNHDVVAGGANFSYTDEQLAETQRLLNELDFLGISAYTPLDARHLVPRSLQKNVTWVTGELDQFRISLPAALPIHFSEISIGGGSKANNGSGIARTALEAASVPYSGMGGLYDPLQDPWKLPDLSEIRRVFYRALLGFLRDNRQVTRAFIWNTGSWDVQGFYGSATEYADPTLIREIAEHNQGEAQP
jgi:hypothetical protein